MRAAPAGFSIDWAREARGRRGGDPIAEGRRRCVAAEDDEDAAPAARACVARPRGIGWVATRIG